MKTVTHVWFDREMRKLGWVPNEIEGEHKPLLVRHWRHPNRIDRITVQPSRTIPKVLADRILATAAKAPLR